MSLNKYNTLCWTWAYIVSSSCLQPCLCCSKGHIEVTKKSTFFYVQPLKLRGFFPIYFGTPPERLLVFIFILFFSSFNPMTICWESISEALLVWNKSNLQKSSNNFKAINLMELGTMIRATGKVAWVRDISEIQPRWDVQVFLKQWEIDITVET